MRVDTSRLPTRKGWAVYWMHTVYSVPSQGLEGEVMGTYFKAVRPDGTDFYTGTVDYASLCGTGASLPAKPVVLNPECCSPDVYHASTVKEGTLIGDLWPCRLFEVEGEPVAEEGSKRGFFTLKVIRELPAHEVFGPHGEEILAFAERVGRLTTDDAVRLAALNRERDADRFIARQTGWESGPYHSRGAAWMVIRGAIRNAAWDEGQPFARKTVWGEAWGVIWCAATALEMRDFISSESFDALYGPWASVMEAD